MTALDPAAHARLEVETSPGAWTDVTGASRSVSVSRHDAGPGTLSAEVLDATLDPTQTEAVRLGRAVRLLVRDEAGTGWSPAFTGALDNVETEVSEDPQAPVGRGTSVRLTGADLVARLAATAEPRGVATVDQLRWLAAGVPFVINGSSATLGSGTVVARNDNATLWDQVLVTRDSALAHAWVDPADRLQVWDPEQMPSTVAAALGPDRYRTVDTDFSPDQVINSVVVNWRRYNIGTETSVDVPYGPYEDASSVQDWGVRQASFTIQGGTEDEAAIAVYAQDVLARNAGAVARVRSAVVPLRTVADLALVRDVDLNSIVAVTLPDGLITQTLRVTGIEHRLTPRGWVTTLEFTTSEAVAAPARTPGTGISLVPPGSITTVELAQSVSNQITAAEQAAQQAAEAASAQAAQIDALQASDATRANQVAALQAFDSGVFPIGSTDISDDAVTTPKLATNAVTTDALAANAITSKHTLTGPVIQTTATAARGIKVTSGALTAYDAAGSPTFTITAATGAVAMKGDLTSGSTVTGATITGATVTGSTLRTGDAGNRVEVEGDSGGGLVRFWSGDSTETSNDTGLLKAAISASATPARQPYLALESPRPNGRAKAYLSMYSQSADGTKPETISLSATGGVFVLDGGLPYYSERVSHPIGTIIMHAASPDDGAKIWLTCDGRAVARNGYPVLFNLIGTSYGAGDGSTTFNLPNLTNRVPRGSAVGSSGGSDTVTMPDHNHYSGTLATGSTNDTMTRQGGSNSTVPHTTHTHNINGQTGVVVGSNPPIPNVPSYLGVNFFIKAT